MNTTKAETRIVAGLTAAGAVAVAVVWIFIPAPWRTSQPHGPKLNYPPAYGTGILFDTNGSAPPIIIG